MAELDRRKAIWKRALKDCEPRHRGPLKELLRTAGERLKEDKGA